MSLGYIFKRGVKTPKREKIEENDYIILSLIGSGAFSHVFLVKHKKNGKIYAMKKQSKRSILDMTSVDKIMEERKMLSSLHHPFIIRLYCSFQSYHHLFMVFEFANGGDLLNHLEELSDYAPFEYGFKESRSRFYAAQIFLALRFLHENKIIFRDLKPDNILLSKDGNIKLCDLGLSKQIKTKSSRVQISTKTVCGTREYFAPEMIEVMNQNRENEEYEDENKKKVKPYTKSIDWWSYGIVLCFFLYGANPFVEMYEDFVGTYCPKQRQQSIDPIRLTQSEFLDYAKNFTREHTSQFSTTSAVSEFLDSAKKFHYKQQHQQPNENSESSSSASSSSSSSSSSTTSSQYSVSSLSSSSFNLQKREEPSLEKVVSQKQQTELEEEEDGEEEYVWVNEDDDDEEGEFEYEDEERYGEIDFDKFFAVLKDQDLKIPHYDPSVRKVSPEAEDLIRKLLTKDPKKRIGFRNDDEIMKHPFFSKHGYDEEMFQKLIDGKVKPPMVPEVENDQDLRYISDEFKMKDVRSPKVTLDDEVGKLGKSEKGAEVPLSFKERRKRIRILKKNQAKFKGYSFACEEDEKKKRKKKKLKKKVVLRRRKVKRKKKKVMIKKKKKTKK